jgi:hypothetical protein
MRRKTVFTKLRMIAIIIIELCLTAQSFGQNPTQLRTQAYPPSASVPYGTPTVSPYLNLGTTPDGISNYQSLVRPLIDEQEAVARQSAALQRLQRQVRGPREASRGPATEPKSRANSPGRFMYYSHYFGAPQDR